MKFKKRIEFYPAYDKRKDGYGVHGVNCKFYLIGEKAVIQFVIYTQWHLPHVEQEFSARIDHMFCKPMAADLGYHSPIPLYEDQRKMKKCSFFEGGCYYDGSSLQADEMFDILIKEGSKGVWKAMKKYYRNIFEKLHEEKNEKTL
ncbi:MAG TPA: hypothetical protein VJ279_08580 [Hanamia sp.]|jgi:hypothetical protein|nr:hypothetical protein [Hanamia sp.]